MKTLLLGALLLSFAINADANQDEHSHGVEASNDVNNAVRLKFMSRRAHQNPAVKNKSAYQADDAWIGATSIDKRESKASKSLNRQFRSKRPHINYQFD